jgi:CheY-like chemotaxis protein
MNIDPAKRLDKILVIDDETGFREVVAKALLRHGFDVLAAADGNAGLQLVADSRPDLILCDLVMPQMDGYQFLSALRQDNRLAEIPVIFLTGEAEPAKIRQGMNLGADDYLTKPANLQDLLGAIHARLARSKKVQESMQELREQLAAKPASGGSAAPKAPPPFVLKTQTETRLINLDEIEAILADGEYCWVHWAQNLKGALVRKSLKRWLAELPGEQFIRIHRRAIINLKFIERVEKLHGGRLQVHLRNLAQPILVSLSQTAALNRRLRTPDIVETN